MKKINLLTKVGILALFFTMFGSNTITPAIANIAAAFPNLPFTTILLVATLPTLFVIPSTIITGMIVGKKVTYKTTALISIGLFVICGAAPYFFNSSFYVILIFRALVGISMGMIAPLGNAVVMRMFEGQPRANLLGLGTLVTNSGAILFQLLGGALSGISWEVSFLAHTPAIISFFIVLIFFNEPKPINSESDIDKESVKKEKVPFSVWLISVLFGISFVIFVPLLLNLSSVMEVVKGVGNSTQAGLALSIETIGGALAGVFFGKFYHWFKRYILVIPYIGAAIGIAIVTYGNSVLLITIGMAITGFFFMMTIPSVVMLIGMYSPPSVAPLSISIMMACLNLSAFCGGYWIQLVGSITGDFYLMPLKICTIVFAIVGILFIFINPLPKNVQTQDIQGH